MTHLLFSSIKNHCPSSDSELYSVSSPETVSPAHSMDLSFSPSSHQPSDSGKAAQFTRSEVANLPRRPLDTGCKIRRTRSKNPSKQRQTASEKEKLRMRDLTKALHHLRTYLPASVAPVGQTLTKIETLRLTIRYISFLSEQLGLSEEVLFKRKEQERARCRTSPEIFGYFQCSSMPDQWGQSPGQFAGSCQTGFTHPSQHTQMDLNQYSRAPEVPPPNELLSSSLDRLLHSAQCTQVLQSCQVYYSCQLVPQDYWS
uniref:BHLH domain-containing protein n=1 Tax=Denticeps clupeoides TaxID=299321 RepID=A0AAY4BB01_9TELE